MRKFYEQVGTMKLYYEEVSDVLGDCIIMYALDGPEVVASEAFPDAKLRHLRTCADRTLHLLDIVTIRDITAGVRVIHVEDHGNLLFGKLAGFERVEYFRRFPNNNRYYKHSTSR